ncbi:MAG: glutamyl-tRNA reductase [Ignavibacteriae bacterium HGW-Ignavibacteriae-2]|jgi:glutamyl-tRNA reductase|nr:MAG: glutamyl-tRNA reductase [Ignavibacteriae bacterium HGW-Ignavibacteriae-2]
MNLIGISINHRTAPIELREALYLSRDEITELVAYLKENVLSCGFILSTCNRTELFGIHKYGKIDFNLILDALINFKKVDGISAKNFEKYFACSAVNHIFQVATGIDSLIIGDSQILGQAKEAFQLSEDLNFMDSILRRVYDTSLKVGKRAIKETKIGEGAVTISFAAVQVVEKIFSSLEEKSALVIGAGETGQLAALHLRDLGIGKLAVSNRTIERARNVAEKLDAEIIPFENLKDDLHRFDIIFSATSAEGLLIQFDDIKNVMKKRKGNPVCLMDIALPRDIDPTVRKLDNVFYNDIDSLKVVVDQNLKKRQEEIPLVKNIIMEEMINFYGWYNTLDVVPTIKTMREFFESIANDELEKIKNKVGTEEYEKINDMTRRLLGRLLHNPTMKLREIAEKGVNSEEVARQSLLVKSLFNLNGNDSYENEINEEINRQL